MLLILCEKCVDIIWVKVKKICLNRPILNLIIMNLSNTFHDEVYILDILDIQNLEDIGQALVNPVFIT